MLKEQDPLIELIRELIMAPVDESAGLHLTVPEVFRFVEDMIAEHVVNPAQSRLTKYLPRVKQIFLPLDLTRAAQEYDAQTRFLARKRVPPTFKEVRHILNLATIEAIASHVQLVTFDADDTIYEDGGVLTASTSKIVHVVTALLQRGIVVSLVTAAGYPGAPAKYEARLQGLLDALAVLTPDERARFFVMGGECNYLLEAYERPVVGNADDAGASDAVEQRSIGLREVPGDMWEAGRGPQWREDDVQLLLDTAERVLRDTTALLHMSHTIAIIRKPRAIGIVNTSSPPKRLLYENLEELCLTLQQALGALASDVPFCAFNGGNDVWVDIGNKAIGIQALQQYVLRFLPRSTSCRNGSSAREGANAVEDDAFTKIQGRECLHVGDRFTRTGNDTRSRDAATTVWISNPQETVHIMKKLLKAVDAARSSSTETNRLGVSASDPKQEVETKRPIDATVDALANETAQLDAAVGEAIAAAVADATTDSDMSGTTK